ncbi:MAG: hypothetical protein WEE64_01300 [Dehalococcoidia bacterium]
MLLDGHGIIHRAYNAFREPLTVRKTGEVCRAPPNRRDLSGQLRGPSEIGT